MKDIDEAAVQLRTAIRLLKRRAYAITGPDGPTRSEQGVLACLEEKGEMAPSTLSALEKVRPQTMGQTLEALDRRSWIKRRADLKDGRRVLISLSPAGRKTLLKARAMRQAWLVDEIEKLSRSDREALFAGIKILVRIAQS